MKGDTSAKQCSDDTKYQSSTRPEHYFGSKWKVMIRNYCYRELLNIKWYYLLTLFYNFESISLLQLYSRAREPNEMITLQICR